MPVTDFQPKELHSKLIVAPAHTNVTWTHTHNLSKIAKWLFSISLIPPKMFAASKPLFPRLPFTLHQTECSGNGYKILDVLSHVLQKGFQIVIFACMVWQCYIYIWKGRDAESKRWVTFKSRTNTLALVQMKS